jgi:hypothetical protein
VFQLQGGIHRYLEVTNTLFLSRLARILTNLVAESQEFPGSGPKTHHQTAVQPAANDPSAADAEKILDSSSSSRQSQFRGKLFVFDKRRLVHTDTGTTGGEGEVVGRCEVCVNAKCET